MSTSVGSWYCLALLFAPVPGVETPHSPPTDWGSLSELPERKAEAFAEAAKERGRQLGSRVGKQAAAVAVESVGGDFLARLSNKNSGSIRCRMAQIFDVIAWRGHVMKLLLPYFFPNFSSMCDAARTDSQQSL